MADIKDLTLKAFKKEVLKKIIFSRPTADAPEKISGRLCAHRGQKILALEFSLSGNTVSGRFLGTLVSKSSSISSPIAEKSVTS